MTSRTGPRPESSPCADARARRTRFSRTPVAALEPLESRTLLAAGALDLSFGAGGVAAYPVVTSVSVDARALAHLPGGKTLAVASAAGLGSDDLFLARYDADGSPDATFGDRGIVTIDPAIAFFSVAAVLPAPDGSVYLAGTRDLRFAVARLTRDGALDPAYGRGGVSTATPGAGYQTFAAAAAVLLPGGRVLVAGQRNSWDPTAHTTDSDPAFVTFPAEGRRAASPAGGGLRVLPGPGYSQIRDLALLPTGQVMAAGTLDSRIALFKINPPGNLDVTFGTDGI